MRWVMIVQARMGSTRLPGKTLKPILGRPLLAYQLDRLQAVPGIHEIVVATSTADEDSVIEDFCNTLGVSCFRGGETDVLARYYEAALVHRADMVLRVTGDCPLIDPDIILWMCQEFERLQVPSNGYLSGVDYLSNTLERTFPRGLDVEIFRFSALEQAWREAERPEAREHVTPFLYQNPQRFALAQYRQSTDESRHRWTVDTPEDFQLIEKILTVLYPQMPNFRQADVLALLAQHSDWAAINAHIEQKSI